ncbi:hypothetical protein CEXT_667411 [Caerostris extrusa]|uniref:Uncharacterized protein n=1 Tax=Caerostris extrusa TaxID=172846 RepID=A0AAV4UVW4_CAEEX|nr:hypothetical protein CEXT_667411 [Caerostris extrusa]
MGPDCRVASALALGVTASEICDKKAKPSSGGRENKVVTLALREMDISGSPWRCSCCPFHGPDVTPPSSGQLPQERTLNPFRSPITRSTGR